MIELQNRKCISKPQSATSENHSIASICIDISLESLCIKWVREIALKASNWEREGSTIKLLKILSL